jgi:hypothetical protein
VASLSLEAAENQLAELADRIALGELRVTRLRAAQQRLERQGEDTGAVTHRLRRFEQTLQRWRDQRQALRTEVTG